MTIAAAGADAIVLVGGSGTRLRPLTLNTAKPMLPLAGVPFMAHLMARIQAAGFDHVVLGTSYRAETFEDYFGDGSDFGLDIDYVVEQEPLGTGGGIRNVADQLRYDTAVIFNGDVLSGMDLPDLLAAHRTAAADVTLHLVRVDDPSRFGSVPTDANGKVTGFLEKTEDPPTDQINAGCYVFRREIIDTIPTGRPVSVEREIFPQLVASGAHVQGFVDSSYWLDIGTPEAFVRGAADLVQGHVTSTALPGPVGASLALPGSTVAPDAIVTGGSTIGIGAHIGAGARIEGSVIFDGAQIAPGAEIVRSVIGTDAVIGSASVVADAIVGDRSQIGAHCELRAGIRIWPDTVLSDSAIRFSPGT